VIRKVDETGRKSDPCTGFVIEKNGIASAFQCIDSAKSLEIEFSDGRKVPTDHILAASRMGDWAVVSADTGTLTPVQRGEPNAISVGNRLLAFNVDSKVRVIGGVDIGGRSFVTGFGARIQLAPAVESEAVGGPLLDLSGRVVGILGGSMTPGARIERRLVKTSQGLTAFSASTNAATAISEVSEINKGPAQSLDQLDRDGILTPNVTAMPEFLYGGTVKNLPRRAEDPLPEDTAEFSRRDSFVNVYSFWKREGKTSKGTLSATVCDVSNHVRVTVPPKKVALLNESTRFSFGFGPSPLLPGVYRIDLLWDNRPVWRTYIRITD
jgi:hypothetical protein